MSAEDLHMVLNEELGKDWREVFSEFDEVGVSCLQSLSHLISLQGSDCSCELSSGTQGKAERW
jgi:hypothetical protein